MKWRIKFHSLSLIKIELSLFWVWKDWHFSLSSSQFLYFVSRYQRVNFLIINLWQKIFLFYSSAIPLEIICISLGCNYEFLMWRFDISCSSLLNLKSNLTAKFPSLFTFLEGKHHHECNLLNASCGAYWKCILCKILQRTFLI